MSSTKTRTDWRKSSDGPGDAPYRHRQIGSELVGPASSLGLLGDRHLGVRFVTSGAGKNLNWHRKDLWPGGVPANLQP